MDLYQGGKRLKANHENLLTVASGPACPGFVLRPNGPPRPERQADDAAADEETMRQHYSDLAAAEVAANAVTAEAVAAANEEGKFMTHPHLQPLRPGFLGFPGTRVACCTSVGYDWTVHSLHSRLHGCREARSYCLDELRMDPALLAKLLPPRLACLNPRGAICRLTGALYLRGYSMTDWPLRVEG